MVLRVLKFQLLIIVLLGSISSAKAQCGTLISSFPYSENFETAPAWTSGGTNSDWAWGAPSHPTISSAGTGSKCWTVGGLSGSFYNYSEQSWIMSPCFDFSSLSYPWISFKIFWEDEWKYDGMVLQYSTNGGTTWTNVGAYGDAVNCLNDHWYNYSNISWLTTASPKNGWTGRTGATSGSCQGGNGSLGWVTAKHCMSSLAGQANVRFRFLFGSGTTCNSYDGIAIDDIYIGNAPANIANFTYACAGGNTISFNNTSTLCPTGYLWNFGDGATSTIQNPSHTYASPGTYNVTLTSSGPCNAPGTITIPVHILGISTTHTNVTCHGAADGSAAAIVTGGTTPAYSWSPGGATTSGIMGLTAGTYTLNVTETGSCPASTTITIIEPTALSAVTASTAVSCFGGNNGSATTTASGGTAPYSYVWTGLTSTTASASSLSAGSYTVTVTDQNNCSTTATALISQPSSAVSVTTTNTSVSCFGGNNGTATATASGGTAPYTYAWTPTASASATVSGLSALSYSVTITDAHGCAATTSGTIIQPVTALNAGITNTPSICNQPNGTANVTVTGGTGPYTYSWSPSGGNSSSATALVAGTYTVSVQDAHSCITTISTTIIDTSAITTTLSSTPNVCYGATNATVSAAITGGTAPYSFLWDNGQTGANIRNLSAGNYCVTASDINGCSDNVCITVTDPPPVQADFTSDPTVADMSDPLIHFTSQSPEAVAWQWNFGDSFSSDLGNPAHSYPVEGTYPVTLIITTAQGCMDSVMHDIIINDGYTFYAPNAFTPNENGNNDIFLPKGSLWDPGDYNLWIFDRWGNMVFHTSNPNEGWNGKQKNGHDIVQSDVYVWKVQLSSLKGNHYNYMGSVTVVK